ncbi:carbohydrate porin [Cognatilysobacter lacus]|uniref:Carbohydrate porin n=1 Tax=Cognatilysobacter lacus TaxID=1643323 RepID=A0A5D8Z2Q4_9GAMM|nr:carbohydrate porin [Lysobacter lacus]TZF89031.1 carbohydrate porin [Lysobacter lacus]
MRSNILATSVSAALLLAGLASGPANAATPAVAATQNAQTAQQIAELRAQLAALQEQINALQAQNDAQSDVNVSQGQRIDAAETQQKTVDKIAKLVNDTQVTGKMFFDVTNIDQTSRGVKTNASGTGLDVKRFYIGINHKFNDIWSANLTTDFQYVSSLDSAADVFVKKAYLQGKFSDAFVFRAGSADMPWIPYVESLYGYRYVENSLTDRLKFANSADWGLHAGGDIADKRFNYAVSVVNGGGYKNPSRSKSMDVEARVGFMPIDGLVVAAGAYSGELGKETQTVGAQHTANRSDLMVAYAKDKVRLGGEYFRANNWNNVLTPASDKADGYSLWGSLGFGTKGMALFARYDQADISKRLDPTLQDTYYNVGFEFPLTKGIKLATVYKNTHRKNATTTDVKTQEVGVWGEVGF